MLTVRPLDENGKWQNKTQKEYLCIKNGEEKGLTADEFKTAKADGWEKQYPYMVGKKKEYMPPSVAEAQGYTRADKHPKSTRYGRQNPISERWNSDEQLLLWRKNWADVNNKYLERNNIAERIDYRSNIERGIDEQPTIHEGVTARIMEQRGFVSDRCEINRQIKADNKLLRELKAQVKKLLEAVKNTIPDIAETLETMRKSLMHGLYKIKHTISKQDSAKRTIDDLEKQIRKFHFVAEDLDEKIWERTQVQSKRDDTPAIKFKTRNELDYRIDKLSKEIERLRTEQNKLLEKMGCKKVSAVVSLNKWIEETKEALPLMKEQEEQYIVDFEAEKQEFFEVRNQYVTDDIDYMQLIDTRLAYRDVFEKEFKRELKESNPQDYDSRSAQMTLRHIDSHLEEDLPYERKSIIKALNRAKRETQGYKPERSKQRDDDELEL